VQPPQSSDYQLAKTLEIENAQLRQDTHDLRKLINNLQQSLVQSKAKTSELGEVIIRLTESDGGQNDALSMMAS
jgi:chromosome segregation ATPase